MKNISLRVRTIANTFSHMFISLVAGVTKRDYYTTIFGVKPLTQELLDLTAGHLSQGLCIQRQVAMLSVQE
jgi:hypothetical protein